MIALLFSGLLIFFAIGVLAGLLTMLEGVGIGLCWLISKPLSRRFVAKHGNAPPAPPQGPSPEEWVRARRKGPPPIPSDAAPRRDENGIPYL